jgi:hypothetical protein
MDRAGWSYPPGDLRVSDADRDRALSELSGAFQVGRITADEFDERSGQALAARTGKELTALLADLPVERPPATRAVGQDQRALANGVAFAATIGAICFALAAAGAALSTGPTLQQQELFRQLAIRQGLPVPPVLPNPGFDWAGTMTPAAIVVLLVVLVVFLRMRVARARRRPSSGTR